MSDTNTVKPKIRTGTKTATERPRLHKVILINDDYTARESSRTTIRFRAGNRPSSAR